MPEQVRDVQLGLAQQRSRARGLKLGRDARGISVGVGRHAAATIVVVLEERQRPREPELAQRRDRRDRVERRHAARVPLERRDAPRPRELGQRRARRVGRHGDVARRDRRQSGGGVRGARAHLREERRDALLKLVERLGRDDDERHPLSRVLSAPEREQRLAQVDAGGARRLEQGLLVARAELGEGVRGARAALLELVEPERVGLEVLGVLRLDRVELARGRRLGEERRDEELREPIERLAERGRGDLEEVARVLRVGVGVRRAAVRREERRVLAFGRVLGRAEEAHVLREVREPRQAVRIGEVTDVHLERGTSQPP